VEGLRLAFEREPWLHFVATGGPVIGHDEATWTRFEKAAATRLPAGRCHALGWIDMPKVLELHVCATVGLNIDGENIETRFGARNRLTNMLGAGVPVVTTRGTEIADWIERGNHGAIIPLGDARALSDALVAAVADPQAAAARAHTARLAACHDFAAARTLTRFLQWADSPEHAPQSPQGAPLRIRQWMESQAANPLPFQPPPPDTLRRKVARRLRRLLG
jgi:glycosyltransferase involved in cell wall biosynthesis